jgi:hypothetical protein
MPPELHLPDGLQRIADLVGLEKAMYLASKQGGLTNVYIPQSPNTQHAWRALLGDDAWKKVCQAFGGQRIHLPLGSHADLKKVAILDLAEQGLNNRQIALQLRVSERYVYQLRSSIGTPSRRGPSIDPRQLGLFKG